MKEQNTLVKYTRSEIDTLPDETDWESVDALTDEDIDAAASSDPDAPPTDASFWKDATVVMPENMEEYSQRQIMGIINEINEIKADNAQEKRKGETVIELNRKDWYFRYSHVTEYERAIESKNNQEQYGHNESR